jgi:hypothetical protein
LAGAQSLDDQHEDCALCVSGYKTLEFYPYWEGLEDKQVEKKNPLDVQVGGEACRVGAAFQQTIASSALDIQIGGDHYKKMRVQPMEYSMANGLDACQHTIVKYVTRFREKGGIQDLEKAKHTIDLLIEFEKENK